MIVLIFGKYGVWGVLAFRIGTDPGAAFILKELSIKAGIETFIIEETFAVFK
jgi:hypothetical protein